MAKKAPAEYPAVGRMAPAFSLPGSNGATVRLSAFRDSKTVVLYFYPRDNTSGCTKQACEFRDASDVYRKAEIEVLGVSSDSLASHDRFMAKHDLSFTLLADVEHEVAEKYGVWQDKTMAGRKYKGIVRTTFVIDRAGKVAHVFERVRPVGHAEAVLHWIGENL